ncbi:hydroxymethylbilane synthase [Bradyrhizobium sp. UFLA03-84]|uniref:hydroxymethylbilane synthase n=1 Tax=Bradyrhizobium sp. UFLA03-84 TaxID=418599 RepID=UPI0024BF5C51|nr:hydroxymethylbilane synthase [Bradyrhizobium sp. UFLA03-84]
MSGQVLRIGTRKSAMALAQTDEVARLLRASAADLAVEIVKFETRGDQDQTSKLLRHGGKGGAFVAEIREAMRSGTLQAAMHSLKDVPGNEETPGLVLAAMLARDAANDSLVLRPGLSLDTLRAARGKGFMIGTNAVRRAAYLRRLFPEATVIHYRGAADTRVAKLDRGDKQRLPDGGEVGPADALVMARSGLERIGMTARIAHDFSVGEMLPAVGQGIVAVECVETDWATRARLAAIDNTPSRLAAEAEREVLWVLNGHCNSPIAGHATLAGAEMTLRASVLDEAGAGFIEVTRSGPADRPRELGRAVGMELLEKGAAEIIARTRPDE